MSDTITVGQVTEALHCHPRAARKLLNDAGAGLDVYADDPGEVVAREIVVDLWAMCAGRGSMARRLSPLLRQTMEASNE